MNELTADWEYEAVGGMTMGADPIAVAMLHNASRPLDAFVVRKADKVHGLQRRIEGPDVSGRKVLAVDDVTTTGSSVLSAVDALRDAGAEVIGVAVIVDRGAGEAVSTAGLPYRAAYTLADLDLSA
jgi:orotate phosphoribosyltransferase